MASFFFELVETELARYFPRHPLRVNHKLTPSERERLAKLLRLTWELAYEFTTDGHAAQKKAEEMEMTAFLPLYQMATFLDTMITQADRKSIASSLQQRDTTTFEEIYDDEMVIKGLRKIIKAFVGRLCEAHGGSLFVPDDVPLGYFSFFDEWQDVTGSCIRT